MEDIEEKSTLTKPLLDSKQEIQQIEITTLAEKHIDLSFVEMVPHLEAEKEIPIVKSPSARLKKKASEKKVLLNLDKEELYDLAERQLGEKWKYLRGSSQVQEDEKEKRIEEEVKSSQNFLKHYEVNAVRKHKICPQFIIADSDWVMWYHYIPQKSYLCEGFRFGKLIMYDINANISYTFQQGERIVFGKHNESATLLITISPQNICIWDLVKIERKSIIDIVYISLNTFDFDPIDENLVCFGFNFSTYTGLSIWNIEEYKEVNSVNNNFDYLNISHVIYDRESTRIFFINEKNSFGVWYLKTGKFENQKVLNVFDKPVLMLNVTSNNENLYVITASIIYKWDIKSIGNEILLNSFVIKKDLKILNISRNLPLILYDNDSNDTQNFQIYDYHNQKMNLISTNEPSMNFLETTEWTCHPKCFYFDKNIIISLKDCQMKKFTHNLSESTNSIDTFPTTTVKENKDIEESKPTLLLNEEFIKHGSNIYNNSILFLLTVNKFFILDIQKNKILITFELESWEKNFSKLYQQPFLDGDNLIISTSFEDNQGSHLKVLNIYHGKCQAELVIKTKTISNMSLATVTVSAKNKSIYFNIENEIFQWDFELNKENPKTFFSNDTKKIKAFDYDINIFIFFEPKHQFIINLNGKNSILIFDIKKNQCVNELLGHNQSLTKFEINTTHNILVSICSEQRIIVWNLESCKEIHCLHLPHRAEDKKIAISNLVISSDGTKIITSQEKEFFIWDINYSYPLYQMTRFTEIKTISYISEKEHLYILDQFSKLECWRLTCDHVLYNKINDLRNFEKIKSYSVFDSKEKYLLIGPMSTISQTLNIYNWRNQRLFKSFELDIKFPTYKKIKYFWSPKSDYIFVYTGENWGVYFLEDESKSWTLLNDEIQYYYSDISEIDFINDDEMLFYTLNSASIMRYTIYVNKKDKLCDVLDFKNPSAIAKSPVNSNLICIGDLEGRITLYDWHEKKAISELKGHSDSIYSLSYRSDGKKICSASFDTFICIWDVDSESKEMKLPGHDLPINDVKFSPDYFRLASCSKDSTIRIWNLNCENLETMVKVYQNVEVNNIQFSKNGLELCAGLNEGLVLHLNNMDSYLQQYLCINLLKNMRFFEELCQQITPDMLRNLSINVLSPFGFSILHSLLYLELYNEFSIFISLLRFHKVNFSFYVDWTGRTVIDIAKDMKLLSLLALLIDYLIEFPPSIKLTSEKFQESLMNLIPMQLNLTDKLLDSRILKLKLSKEFYSDQDGECNTESIKHSQVNLSEFNEIFPVEDFTKNTNKLSFEILAFKDILLPSKNFCEALIEYPSNNAIFISKSVQYVINYKWEHYAQRIHLKRFLDFFLLVILATINSYYLFIERVSKGTNSELGYYSSYNICSAVLNIIIFCYWTLPYLIYEVKDLYLQGFKTYFDSFWNYVDWVNIILLNCEFILDMLNIFLIDNENLRISLKVTHSMLLFSLWLKLLSFSTIFEGTAFIFYSIVRVLLEMRYFLFILAFLDTMISIALFIMQDLYPEQPEEYEDEGYIKKTRGQVLFLYYRVIIGDYGDFFEMKAAVPYLFNIIFLFSTMVMFIIMMNLLISIISMMFGEVLTTKDRVYNKEKAMIIAEIDRNLSSEQEKKIKIKCDLDPYLLICQPKNVELATSHEEIVKKVITNQIKQRTLINTLVGKINFEFGKECDDCKTPLQEFVPQYYCYWCDIYLCPKCGDKVNENYHGSLRLSHPHCLVWIDVNSKDDMKRIDSYKMGKNLWFDEDACDNNFICNGCRGYSSEMENNERWICLSCRPGTYRSNGFIDFCWDCMQEIKKKDEESEKMKNIVKNTFEEEHCNKTHIYLRVVMSRGYQDY